MELAELSAIHTTVVWSSFLIAAVLGAVMQKTNFCTMGAVADIINMGDWGRMRMWFMAIGIAIIGTQGLAAVGVIDLGKSFYTAPNLLWASSLAGGLLFGLGMVLASGCGSKTLVRIGAGSLKSLVVFLVLGLFAYMTLRGVFAVARVASIDKLSVALGAGQDLPRLFATDAQGVTLWRWILGLGIGLMAIGFALFSKDFRASADHWIGGIGVGLAVIAVWYVSGRIGFVEEHPETLEAAWIGTNSGRIESLSFVAPIAYTEELLMLWSDKSKLVTLGIASTLGMIVGSLVYSLATKQFRWEGFGNTEDTANHLVGAALMGIGGVTALGCTVGQGLSGLSTLAIGSAIAFIGIVVGAVLALKYQEWRVSSML
jgi:uncharacterized protein